MNPAQICGMLGQQSLNGARILPRGGRGRVLSHYEVGSLDPAAYGFVFSSYGEGLSPQELFFHAQGGREVGPRAAAHALARAVVAVVLAWHWVGAARPMVCMWARHSARAHIGCPTIRVPLEADAISWAIPVVVLHDNWGDARRWGSARADTMPAVPRHCVYYRCGHRLDLCVRAPERTEGHTGATGGARVDRGARGCVGDRWGARVMPGQGGLHAHRALWLRGCLRQVSTHNMYSPPGITQGLTDTSVKTSKSGYIQRRMMKVMEDKTVQMPGTQVRQLARGGALVQFHYGGDGMDGMRLQAVECDRGLLMCANEALKGLLVSLDETHPDMDTEVAEFVALRMRVRQACLSPDGKRVRTQLLLPVNIPRLVLNVPDLYRDMGDPAWRPACADDVRKAHARLRRALVQDPADDLVTCHLRYHARESLSSQRVATACLSADGLAWVCDRVVHLWERGHVDAGEACGAVAAQSMGELGTQLTLNT